MTETQLLVRFLDDVATQVKDLRIIRRIVHRYPFDSLSTQLLSKAVSLGKAVVKLLDHGFDGEAYGLSRSIVECAITLRYISSDRSHTGARTVQFIWQGKRDRELWLYLCGLQSHSDEQRRDIEVFAAKHGYSPDGKSAHLHWSGERNFIQMASNLSHPLDPSDLEADYHRIARAADYYHPGCFVHCTQPALDSMINFDEPYVVAILNPESGIDFGKRAKIVVFQYVKQIVSFALYGMNVTVPISFTCLNDYKYSDELNEYVYRDAH